MSRVSVAIAREINATKAILADHGVSARVIVSRILAGRGARSAGVSPRTGAILKTIGSLARTIRIEDDTTATMRIRRIEVTAVQDTGVRPAGCSAEESAAIQAADHRAGTESTRPVSTLPHADPSARDRRSQSLGTRQDGRNEDGGTGQATK